MLHTCLLCKSRRHYLDRSVSRDVEFSREFVKRRTHMDSQMNAKHAKSIKNHVSEPISVPRAHVELGPGIWAREMIFNFLLIRCSFV